MNCIAPLQANSNQEDTMRYKFSIKPGTQRSHHNPSCWSLMNNKKPSKSQTAQKENRKIAWQFTRKIINTIEFLKPSKQHFKNAPLLPPRIVRENLVETKSLPKEILTSLLKPSSKLLFLKMNLCYFMRVFGRLSKTYRKLMSFRLLKEEEKVQ